MRTEVGVAAVVPVIMCGGSGSRLWPASTPTRPKQFLPLTGALSSFQETVRRVEGLAEAIRPLVVAGAAHAAAIAGQLAEIGAEADVLLEPEPRDSAAAMAAAAVWIGRLHPGAIAVVVSADHHVPDDQAFRAAVDRAVEGARMGRIVTLGVRPTSPSSAYGYLQPAGGEGVQDLLRFVEKPDTTTAGDYLRQGYLWNSGNFVVSAELLTEELADHAPEVLRFAQEAVDEVGEAGPFLLGESFRSAPKVSIDYAVMEKTKRASVLPVDFEWSDVGAWDAVLDASIRDRDGNAVSGDVVLIDAANTYVRAPVGLRIAAVGVSDIAIVAEDDAILVCDLAHSQSVKKAAELSKARGPMHRDFSSLSEAWAWYERWLKTAALPLWWSLGVDHDRGGFLEAISCEGEPMPAPRRGRVQGRQIYVFAKAGQMGWAGPWRQAASGGLEYVDSKFRRDDGLLRKLVSVAGEPLSEAAAVYDQSFFALALATLKAQGGIAGRDLAGEAERLRQSLLALPRVQGGFVETGAHPFQANCNMHMLEAALACVEVGWGAWRSIADDIAELALARFIDPRGGFLREFFDETWNPVAGDEGRLVEPGHQFEWASLLARWAKLASRPDVLVKAENLFQCGKKGVDARGVACNSLWDDLTTKDPEARLWPQTEYLKASAVLEYAEDALAAANCLKMYLDTPVAGAWFDTLYADGRFVVEPAPASSFYHIISAIDELRGMAQAPLTIGG